MSTLRNYNNNSNQYILYKQMYDNQTSEFLERKKKQLQNLNYKVLNIKDVLNKMDNFIDPSDPDISEKNIIHAYQTAERIRKQEPHNKQLQVVGLIHDIGKILFEKGYPNWCIVGDTFVTGCEYPESLVFFEYAKTTPEYAKYKNDKIGIYKKNCGLQNLNITLGHDEYLYTVLKKNKLKHKLDDEHMDIIRYHSFYPWHTHGEYKYFMNENDKITLKNVQHFNTYDLYSKQDKEFILTDKIKKYYDNLLDHFFLEDLQW